MKTAKVFFITELDDVFKGLRKILSRAIDEVLRKYNVKIDLLTVDNLPIGSITGNILRLIQEADIVISNVSQSSATTMYEIGISHALNKPTILLVDNETQLTFDLAGYRYLTYDAKNITYSLSLKLAKLISEAVENPIEWIPQAKISESSRSHSTVFVSYSHKDVDYLNRLRVHLKPLERKSLIQLWSDTMIQSGDKWKEQIEGALSKAVIAVLLISADFLASDFIVNNELQPLLKSAEQKGTIIIPVILKPCRFLRESSISQFQAINDPSNPLCNLTEYDREDIYERLSQRIEIALSAET